MKKLICFLFGCCPKKEWIEGWTTRRNGTVVEDSIYRIDKEFCPRCNKVFSNTRTTPKHLTTTNR